ncbi:MAG: LacI family transcriptional regulator [Bifidobacteriaceae bacterium]|nr:LacI family transcriptional regulator [Bifidobacteriaceae bacterium]
MVTIRDVARESGYSISTVSRVLSGHPDVSEAARVSVEEVVRRIHFVKNRNAQDLKASERRTIAIIIKGHSNLLFQSILERVQQLVTESGYGTSVEYIDEDTNEVTAALDVARRSRPGGVLFLGGDQTSFEQWDGGLDVPAVVCTDEVAGAPGVVLSSVSTDDAALARCAIGHLLAHGHREIGMIGGDPALSYTSQVRLGGALATLNEHAVPFDLDTRYVACHFSLAAGYDAMNQLLDAARPPTAVFAMADIQAVGAIRALADRGLRVPEDLSLVSCDGIELSQFVHPRLATIRQLEDRLAARSVGILLAHIGGSREPVHEVIPFELCEGESVRSL